MSTEDDRPRSSGDYADGGNFTPGSETYSTGGYGPTSRTRSTGRYDSRYEGGYDPDEDDRYANADTTVLPDSSAYDALTEEPGRGSGPAWHAGADLGLLVLRLVLGGLFIGHGLRDLFGWFQGDGLDGTIRLLDGLGFTDTTALAWVTGLTELVGGTFVLLGLFTPAGAAAILGLMGSAIWVRFNGNVFAGQVELESIFAAAAFAVLFAGPGRVSLDRPTPWYRNASAFGVVFFLIAAGAMITVLLVFR